MGRHRNPKGFTYYEDYDTAMSEADGDWLFFGGGQDVHFVDNYSTMNAREDRARIMEYIMGSDDFADELAAQPAIRQKLTLMVEAVRSGFDTTGWGTPREGRSAHQTYPSQGGTERGKRCGKTALEGQYHLHLPAAAGGAAAH